MSKNNSLNRLKKLKIVLGLDTCHNFYNTLMSGHRLVTLTKIGAWALFKSSFK